MDGGTNPPYRVRCKSAMAGCQRTAANVIRSGPCNPQDTVPAYHETTQYNGNPPGTLPDSSPCGISAEGSGPFGPYPKPYPNRAFAQAGTVNLAVALKKGFKNAQGARYWHGRYGWLTHFSQPNLAMPCTDSLGRVRPVLAESFQPSPPDTKYLSLTASASIVKTGNAEEYPQGSGSLSGRTVAVAPNTGVISLTPGTFSGDFQADLQALVAMADWNIADILGHFGGFVTEFWDDTTYFTTSYSGGVYTLSTTGWDGGPVGVVEEIFVSAGSCYRNMREYNNDADVWLPTLAESLTWSDDTFSYTSVATSNQYYTGYTTDQGVITSTVTASLGGSNPYTDVMNDVWSILAVWDLTNDLIYPWRTDGNTGTAPLVTRSEVQGEVGPVTSEPYTLGWVDPNAALFNGSIIGAPLPAGYGYNADGSSQGIFDFAHQVYGLCSGNDAPDFWSVQGYGSRTPSFLPANCPQWTREDIAARMPPGAWQFYDYVLGPETHQTGLPVMAQKWAEIANPWPSHNFARPAGADRFAFDESAPDGTSRVYQVLSGYHNGTGDTITLGALGLVDDVNGNHPGSASTDPLQKPIGNPVDYIETWGNVGSLDVGQPVINSGDVWGGQSVGGFYTISLVGQSQVLLGQKIFNMPTGWACAPGCDDEATAFGRLRFPNCPGILGRAAVSLVTNASPCHLTLAASPNLAVNLTGSHPLSEQVDICAGDMTVLAANVTLTRVSDTDFTVPNSGATAYATIASAAFIVPVALHDGTTPGTHYWWDDEYPKGDLLVLQFGFNYRLQNEVTRINNLIANCITPAGPFATCVTSPYCAPLGSTQVPPFSAYDSFIQTEYCLGVNPCGPPVICISPNPENFPGSIPAIPFAAMTLDPQYGSRWQAIPMTSMGDPLWQKPHLPPAPVDPITEEPLGAFAWAMDDGSCKHNVADPPTAYYPHMRVVEARATLPNGGGPPQNETAPALPAGVTIGFTSPVANNDSQTAFAPGPGGAVAWVFHDAACGCMASAGIWDSYYSTFVIYC